MLKTRILTALLLGPLLLAAVFLLPHDLFSVLFALLFLVGGWEFTRLCGVDGLGGRLALMAFYLLGFWWLGPHRHADLGGMQVEQLLQLGCLVWLLAWLRMVPGPQQPPTDAWRITSIAFSLPLLLAAWLAVTWLQAQPGGSWLVLMLLLTIWLADIVAYFTGRALGKRKLAPRISPGKTVAGAVGALLITPLLIAALSLALPVDRVSALSWAAVAAVTVLVSIGGDLYISLHKRSTGVKDSGKLFPGHGGVLDRFDSLLAGAPFFGSLLILAERMEAGL